MKNPTRILWIVLAVTTAMRAAVAARLSPCYDEAYYHFWSLTPQLSYFDHPPLVAWAMYLSGLVFGNSVWTVRFWPVLLGLAMPLTAYMLAKEMFDRETAVRSAILLAIVPFFAFNGIIMTPDALLIPCWTLALLFTWRTLKAETGWTRQCVWAGLAIGLGFLAKYTMVLFIGGIGLLWLVRPNLRKRILLGGLLAGAVAFIIFLPVVIWNGQNDWISFKFQFGHGFNRKQIEPMSSLLEYAGALFLVATPFLGLMCFADTARGIVRRDDKAAFLSSFFWVVVIFFTVSAARARVEANWPMTAFITAMILVAAQWLSYARWIRTTAIAIAAGALILAIAYVLLPGNVGFSIAGRQLETFRIGEFIVGPSVGNTVKTMLSKTDAAFVCCGSHQLAGLVSFNAPELRGRLWICTKGSTRFPWIDDSQWTGSNALIVSMYTNWPVMTGQFETCEPLASCELFYRKNMKTPLHFWYATGYKPEQTKAGN